MESANAPANANDNFTCDNAMCARHFATQRDLQQHKRYCKAENNRNTSTSSPITTTEVVVKSNPKVRAAFFIIFCILYSHIQFNCGVCATHFTSANELQAHKRVHDVLTRSYACDRGCKQICFVTRKELNTHIECVHSTRVVHSTGRRKTEPAVLTPSLKTKRTRAIAPTKILCDKCTRAYDSVVELNAHKQREHLLKNYACSACQKVFARQTSVNKHQPYCPKKKCAPIFNNRERQAMEQKRPREYLLIVRSISYNTHCRTNTTATRSE